MLEIIFFLFSFLLCWLSGILLPKTSKMNAIVDIMISYVTTLCWGALGALALQVIGIRISLFSAACVYMIGCITLLGYIIFRHSIQRLEIRKQDIIGLITGALLIGGIALHIFTIYLHLNYHNSIDPSSHYYMAMDIIKKQSISGMYFSQFHNAMLMSIIDYFLPATWSYKAFIIADCFQTLMEFYFAYAFMIYLCRNKKSKVLPIIMTVMYWLGYPLYSFAGGAYVYWAMGGTLVLYVLWMINIYFEKRDLRKYCIGAIVLGCFSVSVCYVQFLPATVLAVLVVIAYCNKRENSMQLNKKQISKILIVLGILAIVAGIAYYVIFYSRGLGIFYALSGGSNTSKNLEMIVAIPIIYYIIYKKIKTKDIDAFTLSLLCFTFVHIILTFLASINLVSSYYLFKDYFILWGFIFIILVGEEKAYDEKIKRYIIHYLLIAVLFLTFLYTPFNKLEDDNILSLDNSIYRHNIVLFRTESYRNSFVESKMNLIEYVADNYEYPEEKVALIGTNEMIGTCAWYAAISGQYIYYYAPFMEEEQIEEFLKNSDADYILIFYGSKAYEEKKEYFETYEKVYDSEEGFICRVK